MADGRYQAEPRLPRTQAMRWLFRAASRVARDRAGHRFSTSDSEMRDSGGITSAKRVGRCVTAAARMALSALCLSQKQHYGT
jgi:hypothetical protein